MSSIRTLLTRLAFLVILCLPAAALAVLYAESFEPLRRAYAERLLNSAVDVELEVRGPIVVGFGWEPTISIADIAAVESELPDELKAVAIKSLSLELPLLPLLVAQAQAHSLTIDGLKVAIDIPVAGATPDKDGGVDVGKGIGEFVRSRFAGDLLLRDADVNYANRASGFTVRYEIDAIESKSSANGVVVNGTGRVNGEPWKLDGKVDPPAGDGQKRTFVLSEHHSGLTNTLSGSYDRASDTVDMTVSASTPNLEHLLRAYGISGDLDGSANISGRLTGSLDALKLTGLDLSLAFESGDKFELKGNVADIGAGTGLDLNLTGALERRPPAAGEQRLYDIGVTGFNGRIEGSVDGVLIRDFHVVTASIRANLHEIGPITAERVFKDPEGHLGLYDVLVLAGDPKRPSLRVAGTVKDIIAFKQVDLKGQIDFLTADFLDLAAEEHAQELGHLSGDIAISDADGSLGIEQLTAKVTDSSLIKLDINLVFDDIPEAKEIKFDTTLDIPNFKSFAAALGSKVAEESAVKFNGTLSGSDEKIVMSGTTIVGQTTITGSLAGALSEGKPVLSGDISSQLLHLADLLNFASLNTVYQDNVDEQDADVFDYSKVWESLFVDLQINVAKIAGGGTDASNIAGRVTYLAGMVGLAPVTLTYLGGKVTANGDINTAATPKTFALKGVVDNLLIGEVLKEMRVSYPVSGSLHVAYDVTGAGNTKAEIPRSLNGSLTMSLYNGWIGTGLLDLAGMSLPAWLLTRTPGGNQATLVCAVAPFSFRNGLGTTHSLVLETRDVQVVGVGTINFPNDLVNLRFKPQALQDQFIKIAQPFAIEGKLGSPVVTLTGNPVAGAVTEVIAFPFNLLDAIVQPLSDAPGRIPCRVEHPR